MHTIDKALSKMLGKAKKNKQLNIGMSNSINKILGKNLNFPRMSSKPSKKDWDGDGIPNFKDCQPRNIMRQDSNKIYGVVLKTNRSGVYFEKPEDAEKIRQKYGENYTHIYNIDGTIIYDFDEWLIGYGKNISELKHKLQKAYLITIKNTGYKKDFVEANKYFEKEIKNKNIPNEIPYAGASRY